MVAEIQPFRAVLYRLPAEELGRVLAPPYDVIGPDEQERLYERDPRNIVRVVLNRTPGDARYEEAKRTYKDLLNQGVLSPDPDPALYVLEQTFSVDDHRLRRYGVIARFRAEDPGTGRILPHEATRSAPREDRYRLLQATRANFSPIFLMFSSSKAFSETMAEVVASPPALVCSDDAGIQHRVWRVLETPLVRAFQASLAAVPSYIADGHHRYQTALRHRDDVGPDGSWTCGYFTPMDAPGLMVLPYHRVVTASAFGFRTALGEAFAVTSLASREALAAAVRSSKAPYAFGLADRESNLLAESKEAAASRLGKDTPKSLASLDTFFLHRVLFEELGVAEAGVQYVHSLKEARREAEEGGRLAILMRATPVSQIVAVADAKESMPPKSTFFYPKLPSGLVIHPLLL